MDEAALLAAARRGDVDAFNHLVLAYQDAVYSIAYRMLGDPDAAADVTQETFLSAFRHLRSFRGGSFRGWLFRIATNACYDELRRRQRRPTLPLEGYSAQEEDTPATDHRPWMADGAPSPEEQVQRGELRQALEACLKTLPPAFRAAVLLVDVQGLDYQEAAQALGCPLGTLKSRLARGRAAMRSCLQGYRELLPDPFRQHNDER